MKDFFKKISLNKSVKFRIVKRKNNFTETLNNFSNKKSLVLTSILIKGKTNYIPGVETSYIQQKGSTPFIYPFFAVDDYQKNGLKDLKDNSTLFLLEEVDRHVNELDFDSSIKYYYTLLANQETSMDRKYNQSTKRKITRLHKKLCLLIKLNQLSSCMERKDFLNLKYILNDMAALYNELTKKPNTNEKIFLQNIEHYHGICSQALLEKS